MIRRLSDKDKTSMRLLLKTRHKRDRACFEGLNKRFEEDAVLDQIIDGLFKKEHLIALGRFKGPVLQAYIVSHVKIDQNFGRCAWVTYEGCVGEKEDLKVLYTEISDMWIKAGCLTHYIIAPQVDTEAWLELSFSYEQVFGISKLYASNESHDMIRLANSQDGDLLEKVSSIILSYQAKSPVYAPALPEMFEIIKKGYRGLSEDEDAHMLIAENESGILGFACGYFDGEVLCNMMMPYKGMELAIAGTLAENQEKGLGTGLTRTLFDHAIDAGYEYSLTDWRITNLKSSRFWPKMGYKPFAYRMVRHIDERVYWADGDNRF